MYNRLIAILLFLLLLPILVFIAFIVVVSSGMPILYAAKRGGYHFKEFKMFKFRTMYQNTGSDLTAYNDNRITKAGLFLRKFKLDELVQLVNIIKGDMNFIGPRPEVMRIVNNNKNAFRYLNIIKPGITDISSIIFKNESNILKKIDISEYEKDILPIKIRLVNVLIEKKHFLNEMVLFVVTLISLINHSVAIYIIKYFFLNDLEIEFRIKLNHILSKNFF